jgi:hypothetical protein
LLLQLQKLRLDGREHVQVRVRLDGVVRLDRVQLLLEIDLRALAEPFLFLPRLRRQSRRLRG